MRQKIDKSIIVFSAGVILRQLTAIHEEIGGVQEARDIEYVHRMRVASRRLRNAMSVFELYLPKKKMPEWQNTVKKITKALGEARDTDVRIALIIKFYKSLVDEKYRPGVSRLQLRLEQYRAH